jgi:hypothetical protein
MKSRRISLEGHVASMGDIINAYKICVANHEERRMLEKPRISGRMILHWILKKWNRKFWTRIVWLKRGAFGMLLYIYLEYIFII